MGPSLYVGALEKGEVERNRAWYVNCLTRECLRVILVVQRVMVMAQECVKRRAFLLTVLIHADHSVLNKGIYTEHVFYIWKTKSHRNFNIH